MKKSIVVFLTILAVLALFAGCGSGGNDGAMLLQEGKLLVGTDPGYPPFQYINEESGEIDGFEVELAEMIGEKLGLEVEFVENGFDAIFVGLDSMKYDCILSAVSMTNDRMENYLFTTPHLANGQVIVVKPGDTSIQSHEDLTGKKVGVQFETTSDHACQKQLEAGLEFELIKYDSIDQAFLAMRSEKVECIVVDMGVALDYCTAYPEFYEMSSVALTNEPISICIKKDNTELQAAIQGAMDEIIAEGALSELCIKWLGDDFTQDINTELTE